MERPSFGTRARQRIWRDTVASVKGRITPFFIGTISLMLVYLTNHFWLHLNTANQLAILSAVSLGGSYAIWFLGALLVNTLRVPWLLDAESNVLITSQEKRAEAAENNLAEVNAARQKHDCFGRLMQQGNSFSREIAECQTEAHLVSWDRHSNEWIKSVDDAMRDMGFPAEAVEFVSAYKKAEPVRGVVNIGLKQEQRRRGLEKHLDCLTDFVHRRLT